MVRSLLVASLVVATAALAQGEAPPDAKIVIVPYPGSDAGVTVTPPPAPPPVPVEPVAPALDAPPTPPVDAPTTRTLEAVPPVPPVEPENTPDPAAAAATASGPTVMLDGMPREGAFLSGPGSLTFILHHTLMTGFGVLATQMIPRGIAASLMSMPSLWTDEGARIAYLAGTLLGAGLGFTGAAVWQFFHWMSHSTATFGIVNSFFGGLFLGGLTDLATNGSMDPVGRAYAVSWLTILGNSAGAWLTAILGGGQLAVNKGLLIASGGMWAGLYTALIVGVVASLGGLSGSARGAMQAVMITPAIGAAAMALATLKFNPSVTQIMRANVFGLGIGAGVLLLSALVLGANFGHPVPYILGAVGAIGAKTIVSLLWVEAANNPGAPTPGMPPQSTREALEAVIW
jgi:hypothetical protein